MILVITGEMISIITKDNFFLTVVNKAQCYNIIALLACKFNVNCTKDMQLKANIIQEVLLLLHINEIKTNTATWGFYIDMCFTWI